MAVFQNKYDMVMTAPKTELQSMKAANPKAVDADIAFWQRNDVKQTEQVKSQLLKILQTK